MNGKLILRFLGRLLMAYAAAMLAPLILALCDRSSDAPAFLFSAGLAGVLGGALFLGFRQGKGSLLTREAFLLVGVSWPLLGLFGTLPFVFSGAVPGFIDCLFESMSGITTTGATILLDVEALPRGLLLWRCMLNWIGGLGVLVLFLALLPNTSGPAQSLIKVETTGPTPGKIVPRVAVTAKILYCIYLLLTAAQMLLLLASGLEPFHAVTVAFSTAGTGGFTAANASIAAFQNPLAETIIGVFMLLFSLNFSLYYLMVVRKWAQVKKSTDLKYFSGIVVGAIMLIGFNIRALHGGADSIRFAFFQVASAISSTGFFSAQYGRWPEFSQFVLVLLMLIGACGGSTGGGIKVSRIAILFKAIHREIKKIIHPRSVPIIRYNGAALSAEVVTGTLLFIAVYIGFIFFAALIISLDGFGLTTSFTAATSMVSNTGIGLGSLSPGGSFAPFSPLSKIVLIVCMLLGRLEIFPVLVLLSPSAWLKK